jgi:hypothetical protein
MRNRGGEGQFSAFFGAALDDSQIGLVCRAKVCWIRNIDCISEEAMNDCEFAIGASDERFWNIVAIQDLERRRFVHLGVEIYRAVRCVVIPP